MRFSYRAGSPLALALLALLPIAATGAPTFPVQEAPRTASSLDPANYLHRPDVEAEATRNADQSLTLRWTYAADRVEVSAGERPDAIDYSRPLGSVSHANTITLPDVGAASRRYFALKFFGGRANGKTLTVAERFVPLQGAHNFRDLGGYRTRDGRHVRWGLVYRSETLGKLTDADREFLGAGLHLRAVCDFRGASEAAADPDRLPETAGPTPVALSIDAGHSMTRMAAAIRSGDAKSMDDAMADLYIGMVDDHGADAFGPFIARLADPDNLPTVYHCAAGKDRTGIATALLLTLLGVPRKTVLADYSLTNLTFDTLIASQKGSKNPLTAGLPPQVLARMTLANPEWLQRTLEHIDAKYGSVEGYLQSTGRIDAATIAKIRANLLQ